MTFSPPTTVRFTVLSAEAAAEIAAESGVVTSHETLSLVLRSSRDANMCLSSGLALCDIDVQVTLSSRWKAGVDLDRDLKPEDVGFLVHTAGENGESRVHGGAIIMPSALLAAIVADADDVRIDMVLASVPYSDDQLQPFVWGRNRGCMLPINRIEVRGRGRLARRHAG